MSDNHINFTRQKLGNLPIPDNPNRRDTYYDTPTPGLQLRITHTGSKIFSWRRRVAGGKDELVTLGKWPEVSISDARKYASQLNFAALNNASPVQIRREIEQEMTFGELFAVYLERWSKVRKKTWQDDEANFRLYCGDLVDIQLSRITRQVVASLHSKIGETHQITANRVLALISSVFGRARELDLWKGDNPCVGIRRFKEESRTRFFDIDELERLFKAIDEESNKVMRSYFLVALLTGARRSDVLEMRWDHINFDHAVWCIPKTKNGLPLVVPLLPKVINLLRELQGDSEEWVFSSPMSVTGHLVEPKSAWARILKKTGIENARIHDLRRTLGSWQAITGSSMPIIGKTLGHQSQQATAVYARLSIDPVRESMQKAVDKMTGKSI